MPSTFHIGSCRSHLRQPGLVLECIGYQFWGSQKGWYSMLGEWDGFLGAIPACSKISFRHSSAKRFFLAALRMQGWCPSKPVLGLFVGSQTCRWLKVTTAVNSRSRRVPWDFSCSSYQKRKVCASDQSFVLIWVCVPGPVLSLCPLHLNSHETHSALGSRTSFHHPSGWLPCPASAKDWYKWADMRTPKRRIRLKHQAAPGCPPAISKSTAEAPHCLWAPAWCVFDIIALALQSKICRLRSLCKWICHIHIHQQHQRCVPNFASWTH